MPVRPSFVQYCFASLLLFSKPAGAEAASWLFLGGGVALNSANDSRQGLVQLDTGLGSDESRPLIVGVLGRAQLRAGEELDVGVFGRLATRGFARGGWGAALDAGYLQPLQEAGGMPSVGLALGGPWGATATMVIDPTEPAHVALALGFDFARLTVHRHTGLDWLDNPGVVSP